MAAAAAEMLIPLKRIGTPDEAAGAMLMLASPYASFISGQARLSIHLTRPSFDQNGCTVPSVAVLHPAWLLLLSLATGLKDNWRSSRHQCK